MNTSTLSKVSTDSLKKCLNCGNEFRFIRANKKYCGGTCRLQARRKTQNKTKKKKRKSPIEHLSGSLFGKYLYSKAIESETVQIFPPYYTEEMFLELHELYKTRMHSNGTGIYQQKYPNTFEICHKAPAKGNGYLGYLIPTNLFVAPAILNRKLGSKPTGYSRDKNLSIPRSKLLSKWKVKEKDSVMKVLKLIDKHVNGALLDFQKTKKLKAYVSRESSFKGIPPLSDFRIRDNAFMNITTHLGMAIPTDVTFEDLLTGHFETRHPEDIFIPITNINDKPDAA